MLRIAKVVMRLVQPIPFKRNWSMRNENPQMQMYINTFIHVYHENSNPREFVIHFRRFLARKNTIERNIIPSRKGDFTIKELKTDHNCN